MKIYLVRGCDYVDFGSFYGGRIVKKNRVIRCCETKDVAEQFVTTYQPFASTTNETPDRYVISDVDPENRYSTKAVREVKCVDREGEFYTKRVAFWVEERNVLCAEEA